MPWAPYTPHPACEAFPLVNGEELEALASSISELGLLEPIHVAGNVLLDGRNRWRACELAGVALRFQEVADLSDPVGWIAARNLARRHLAIGQRAMIAARLSAMLEPTRGRRRDAAAKRLAVSPRTVGEALVVLRAGDEEMIAAIDAGELAVSEAARLTRAGQSLRAIHSSESHEWYTPAWIVELARLTLGTIDLDPASSAAANKRVRAVRYYALPDNGLELPWAPRVFTNPPYGRGGVAGRWVARAIEAVHSGESTAVLVLVGASTEADWFLPLWNYPLAFIRGRVNFHRGSGEKTQGQTRGSVIACVHREGREGREIARRFVCHFQTRAVIVRAPLIPLQE